MSQPEVSRPDPARVFAALGDPVRLDLLARLDGTGSKPLGRLVDGCGISRQGATKHLKVLEDAGLIVTRTQGRERHVSAAPQGLAQAQAQLEAIARGWDNALARLKAHVERDKA